MFQKPELKELKPFPANADVRIIVSGLAFCEFAVGKSKVHFLRHVPYHKLTIEIKKKKQGSETWINVISPPMDILPGEEISINPKQAIKRKSIKARGEENLNKLVNFNENDLHKGKAKLKSPLPPIQPPTVLTINDCVFYTDVMSKEKFYIKKKRENPSAEPKYIGYTLGGKIRYKDSTGETIITLGNEVLAKLPKIESGNEFVYNVIFTNHCGDENSDSDPLHDLCENLMGNDTDFRFYYDLIEDKTDRKIKFTLEKEKTDKTADVGACNVTVKDPPVIPPDEEP